MAMQIEKSFVVRAPADAVWAFLIDPHRVARCLPGAAITEQIDERAWGGTITVKVGPVTANYRGKLRFERLDAQAREAEIAASGQETRGKGAADMKMRSRVVARDPRTTEVTVTSEVNVVGILAQFGRGMIQDVSDQLFEKFSAAMRRELELPEGSPAASPPVTAAATSAPPPAPAADAPREEALDLGSIGAAAAGRAAGRALRSPGLWIALAVVAFLIYWFLVR